MDAALSGLLCDVEPYLFTPPPPEGSEGAAGATGAGPSPPPPPPPLMLPDPA